MHKIFVLQEVYFVPLDVSSTSALHQEVKIALHNLCYHHTYRCDDNRYQRDTRWRGGLMFYFEHFEDWLSCIWRTGWQSCLWRTDWQSCIWRTNWQSCIWRTDWLSYIWRTDWQSCIWHTDWQSWRILDSQCPLQTLVTY